MNIDMDKKQLKDVIRYHQIEHFHPSGKGVPNDYPLRTVGPECEK